jgi:hypothetical protein
VSCDLAREAAVAHARCAMSAGFHHFLGRRLDDQDRPDNIWKCRRYRIFTWLSRGFSPADLRGGLTPLVGSAPGVSDDTNAVASPW